MKNLQTSFLIFILCGIALGLMYLKVTRLGLPLLPGQVEPVWSVEAKIEFDPGNQGTIVDFDIPDNLGNFVRLDEYFVGRGYGLAVETEKKDRRAEWSTRRAKGKQRLYYRIEFAPTVPIVSQEKSNAKTRAPKPPLVPPYEEPMASAIEDLLADVRDESANIFTFVSQLLGKLNNSSATGNISVIRGNITAGSQEWVDRLIYVLAGARISARMVRGAILDDGASNVSLVPWLEVHNGEKWEGFDPQSGDKGYPDNFVRWSVGSEPLLNVENGKNTHVSFAISRYSQSLASVAKERAEASKSWLSNILLFELPISTQNVYRTLLMIPLGALIVGLMRTIVGIPTLGTFMPILIAIAFRETELMWGIMLFIFVSFSGLMLRFYLERLQLLLVPRLCSVLVLVVLLMLAISMMGAHLGLDRGFSVALFPIVILTMVIEHMSVVWEETGPLAAFKEGMGSLFVAIIGYLVMTNDYLTHIVFLFPEVLLLLLASFILLGRYTGYRVTEIFRFRDIVEGTGKHVQ